MTIHKLRTSTKPSTIKPSDSTEPTSLKAGEEDHQKRENHLYPNPRPAHNMIRASMAKYKDKTDPSQTSILGFLEKEPKSKKDDKNTTDGSENDKQNADSLNILKLSDELYIKTPSGPLDGPLLRAQSQVRASSQGLSDGVVKSLVLKKEENKESTSNRPSNTYIARLGSGCSSNNSRVTSCSPGRGLHDVIILDREEKCEYNSNKEESKTYCNRAHSHSFLIGGRLVPHGGGDAGGGAGGRDSDHVLLPAGGDKDEVPPALPPT